jgi:hypothetical protein
MDEAPAEDDQAGAADEAELEPAVGGADDSSAIGDPADEAGTGEGGDVEAPAREEPAEGGSDS